MTYGKASLADHERGVQVPPAHHGRRCPDHADEITLPARPYSVSAARAHARQVLRFWAVGLETRRDMEQVVSELMTNAIAASVVLEPVRPVHLILFAGPGWLLTAVADASPRFPLLLHPDGADAVHGRGLHLVGALSSRWGWQEANWRHMKKVVWSEFPGTESANQKGESQCTPRCTTHLPAHQSVTRYTPRGPANRSK